MAPSIPDSAQIIPYRQRRRKRVAVARQPLAVPTGPRVRWSMDFVSDALASGRKFRALTIVDDYTRE